MKKKLMNIFAMLMAVVMILCLSGCGVIDMEDPTVTVGGQTPAQVLRDFLGAVLQVILMAIALAFTKVLLPWVRHTLIPWMENKHLMDIVRIFVAAAEKQGETGAIVKERKKEYVINMLQRKGIIITPEIEDMIEAAVEELDLLGDQLIDAIDGGSEAGSHADIGFTD